MVDRLRVAIDAHMVGEQETGNETYIINLVRGLSQIDTSWEYLLYSPHPESLTVCGPLGPNFGIRHIDLSSSVLRIPIGLPRQVKRDDADVLHVTYIAPPVVPSAVVATVHDISYVLYPETFSQRDRVILGTLVPRTLKSAQIIITVSESSKRDIVSHYGVPQDKVIVVYQPISSVFKQLDNTTVGSVLARLDIRHRYILAVGNLQPRKNLLRLIRAFAKLRKAGAYQGKLVLVGKSKWKESAVYQEVRTLGIEDEVVLTGYISETEVAALYNAADIFVYPSIYEGFGLPPLEAMACGCPVVTGNTSSLPEVVATSGIMVDPYSEDQLASAIISILRSPDLRTALVTQGLQRVKQFSATAAASITRQAYAEAVRRYRDMRTNIQK